MLLLRKIRQYTRSPRDLYDAILKRIIMFQVALRNLYSSALVVSPGGPVVSLTTYGRRLSTVHFTIETIGRGYLRPSRLILWLDDIEGFHNLPPALRRLSGRGLEVRLCRNYGPHKKYYSYVETESIFRQPLATADDDVLYPRFWLKRLFAAFKEQPEVINCNFARRIRLTSSGMARFSDWPVCSTTKSSFCHHAIGMSGVIYPPAFLAELKQAGTGFTDCCPKADDLWLHVQALRAGYRVRQLTPWPNCFHGIPGTEGASLWKENGQGGNDAQAGKTYTDADIEVLRHEPISA